MKMSASSSLSSSTFSTRRFFAAEGPFSGLLFFFSFFLHGSLSCEESSCSTGLGTKRRFFLSLAGGSWSSSSELGNVAMPLTSKEVVRLLELPPI